MKDFVDFLQVITKYLRRIYRPYCIVVVLSNYTWWIINNSIHVVIAEFQLTWTRKQRRETKGDKFNLINHSIKFVIQFITETVPSPMSHKQTDTNVCLAL